VTPYSDVVRYQRFGGQCCLHLQGYNLKSRIHCSSRNFKYVVCVPYFYAYFYCRYIFIIAYLRTLLYTVKLFWQVRIYCCKSTDITAQSQIILAGTYLLLQIYRYYSTVSNYFGRYVFIVANLQMSLHRVKYLGFYFLKYYSISTESFK
jgi:hypothetical protein